MKEFLIKFLENNWQIAYLTMLWVMLAGSHAFMIHYNRPDKIIAWNENMITGTFAAIIAKLK